jgi:mannose-6-phosphate isomerase-like protein (cupin superfamily)
MPRLVPSAAVIPVPGSKKIEEYIGRVNTKDTAVSIAHMHSPSGWSEPGQQPEFDEYTVVLKGVLRVESKNGVLEVKAGQAVIAPRGEWVRYSTPGAEGADYIAVCLAAFDPATVHRDAFGGLQ